MRFFNYPSEASSTNQKLVYYFKKKLAWQLWMMELEKKSLACKDTNIHSLLWIEQAGLANERLSFLSLIEIQLSTSKEQTLVQQNIVAELTHTQGNTEQLIDQWTIQYEQLKKQCFQLEQSLHQRVSVPAKISGELVHLITSQPSYIFASTSISTLSSSTPSLALDDIYVGIFKHLSGILALTIEIGIYFYCDQLFLYSIQFFQAFLNTNLVLNQLHLLTSKYVPEYELSLISRIKENNILSLSIIFSLIHQCWFESSLSQGIVKWSLLAIAIMLYDHMSKKVSTHLCKIFMSKELPVIRIIIQQLLMLCAGIYLYPWLAHNIDSIFLTNDLDSQKKALDVLGLGDKATPSEIRNKVRTLFREYHPDVNSDPGARDRFLEIQAAAETLKRR